MIDDITFNYIDEKGNSIKYVIIDKFTKNNKNYIIYEEENKEELYGALYEIIDDKIKIIPIENEKDYDIIDEYLDNL